MNFSYCKPENGIYKKSDGTKEWYKDGKLHREDGPAIEYLNGNKEWYLNGIKHRLDGPAIILNNRGIQFWYKHGELHREDGPAIETSDGDNQYWLSGKQYHKEHFDALIAEKNKNFNEFNFSGYNSKIAKNYDFSDFGVKEDLQKAVSSAKNFFKRKM